jgi:hypothetical protein
MLVAALLFAGPTAAIDGVDACRFHGVRAVAQDENIVHIAVPRGAAARSSGFVVVRQTARPLPISATNLVRYVDPATAADSAARRLTRPRAVLAVLSDALQRDLSTYDELLRAHVDGPPRNSRLTEQALEQLGTGVRSVAEADFRNIAARSRILPALEYNLWLRLRCGRVVCVDALIRSSAVVHEVNGRIAHAREDLFEGHSRGTPEGVEILVRAPQQAGRLSSM